MLTERPSGPVAGSRPGSSHSSGGRSSGGGSHHGDHHGPYGDIYKEVSPFLGEGKDLRAKARPRFLRGTEPLPGEYHAAEAPDWGEWLPPGAYPAPDDPEFVKSDKPDNKSDDPGKDKDPDAGGAGDGPKAGDGGTSPDVPFTLGNQ